MYEAVVNIAVPIPSIILSRKLNVMNDAREGIMDTNLMCMYVVCVRVCVCVCVCVVCVCVCVWGKYTNTLLYTSDSKIYALISS